MCVVLLATVRCMQGSDTHHYHTMTLQSGPRVWCGASHRRTVIPNAGCDIPCLCHVMSCHAMLWSKHVCPATCHVPRVTCCLALPSPWQLSAGCRAPHAACSCRLLMLLAHAACSCRSCCYLYLRYTRHCCAAQVGKRRPGDPEVPKMLARLHHQAGQPLRAIQVLEAHMEAYPSACDLTHVNILAELYMDRVSWL